MKREMLCCLGPSLNAACDVLWTSVGCAVDRHQAMSGTCSGAVLIAVREAPWTKVGHALNLCHELPGRCNWPRANWDAPWASV